MIFDRAAHMIFDRASRITMSFRVRCSHLSVYPVRFFPDGCCESTHALTNLFV